VDAGRRHLELDLGYRPRPAARLRRLLQDPASGAYLGSIALATALFTAGAVAYALRGGATSIVAAAVGLLAVLPASEFVIGCLQSLWGAEAPRRLCPRRPSL